MTNKLFSIINCSLVIHMFLLSFSSLSFNNHTHDNDPKFDLHNCEQEKFTINQETTKLHLILFNRKGKRKI